MDLLRGLHDGLTHLPKALQTRDTAKVEPIGCSPRVRCGRKLTRRRGPAARLQQAARLRCRRILRITQASARTPSRSS